MNGLSEKPLQFYVKTEEDSYNLEAAALRLGQDWLISIWGGVRPHIGAVAAAQPRPSLKDEKVTSATASVLCFLGHKEDVIVKDVSEKLAASLKTNVVVTAGIHWDDIDLEGIQRIIDNCRILISKIKERIDQCENLPNQTELL
jgi:hypothetical protein